MMFEAIRLKGDHDGDNVREETIIPKPTASQARQMLYCLMHFSHFTDNQEFQFSL